MKRLVVLSAAIALLLSPAMLRAAPAQPDSQKTAAEVLAEIRQSQGATEDSRIDPAKINDQQLEKLGGAVMEERRGDRKRHQWLESMVGGEGSSSLAAMHRRIGLGYLSGGRGGMFPGMMGRPGPGRRDLTPRDSDWRRSRMPGMMRDVRRVGLVWAWIFVVLIWAIMILGIVLLIRTLVKSGRPVAGQTALEILKTRYARGEIGKQEYEEKKKDIAQA
jgi:putative membrane protein